MLKLIFALIAVAVPRSRGEALAGVDRRLTAVPVQGRGRRCSSPSTTS